VGPSSGGASRGVIARGYDSISKGRQLIGGSGRRPAGVQGAASESERLLGDGPQDQQQDVSGAEGYSIVGEPCRRWPYMWRATT